MPVLPISHFTWQVLRTVKRSKKPPTGRVLRLVPNRRTKDGTFLTDLVERGLLAHVTGSGSVPFEATYALTERGEYAAEYGEADFPAKTKLAESSVHEAPGTSQPQRHAKTKGKRRGSR